MVDDNTAHREAYARTRADFEALSLEDRALFLVEATASTLACGIDRAGHAAADELDDLFAGAERKRKQSASSKQDASDTPGAAEQ